jgi:hypothetical protein
LSPDTKFLAAAGNRDVRTQSLRLDSLFTCRVIAVLTHLSLTRPRSIVNTDITRHLRRDILLHNCQYILFLFLGTSTNPLSSFLQLVIATTHNLLVYALPSASAESLTAKGEGKGKKKGKQKAKVQSELELELLQTIELPVLPGAAEGASFRAARSALSRFQIRHPYLSFSFSDSIRTQPQRCIQSSTPLLHVRAKRKRPPDPPSWLSGMYPRLQTQMTVRRRRLGGKRRK